MAATLVIAGSVRPTRIAVQVADWVAGIGRAGGGAFEVLDLRDWPLPMDDEPDMPQRGVYAQPHTRAWSAKIAAAPGFVFVTPQYNWGYPAALKNAIDHLYREWADKPAVIVSYGGHGGGKCGAQLREVLAALKLRTVATCPELTLPRALIEANTGEIDATEVFATHVGTVRQALDELAAALAA
ncbi:NADPH-dependent FMN reductase [Sphingomonas sp. GC_Shp_3]|uniref:NADPH-dependent FMN reductase n=1 Tax=Sphingomonas sp. GC_Shp_3 TaxID=2937383 RepID=UPI002269C4D8|nr:NADPH-dependent FMN reductase [Sphingomonas sp. GC_Shp_3]